MPAAVAIVLQRHLTTTGKQFPVVRVRFASGIEEEYHIDEATDTGFVGHRANGSLNTVVVFFANVETVEFV